MRFCSQIRAIRNEIKMFVREALKGSEEAAPKEEQSSGKKASLQSYEAAVGSQQHLVGANSFTCRRQGARTCTVQGAGEEW